RAQGEERGEAPGGDHRAVEREPRTQDPARSTLEGSLRVVTDEPPRATELVHDLVARVDAGGATDAVELQAVADVDAGRADDDAALAVHAVPRVRVARLAAGLAALRVVADHEGVLVGHHR